MLRISFAKEVVWMLCSLLPFVSYSCRRAVGKFIDTNNIHLRYSDTGCRYTITSLPLVILRAVQFAAGINQQWHDLRHHSIAKLPDGQ
jgi:hypothetical protein